MTTQLYDLIEEGKVSERMLYTFIVKYLNDSGFKAVQNPNVKYHGKRYEPDIILDYENFSGIIEVEVGKESKLIEGITQVYNHLMSMGKKNSIVILYPSEIRRPYVSPKQVSDLVFNTEVTALIFSEFGSKKFTGQIGDLFKEIKEVVKSRIQATDIYFAIDVIKDSIKTISDVLRYYSDIKLKDAINSVIGRLDLFSSLGEIGKEKINSVVIDLMSYLLVDQILFYHVYSEKTKKIDPLNSKIQNVNDLFEQFKKIRNINYAAIYSIDIVSKLPNDKKIIESLEKIIKSIKIIKPENVQQDIIGRLFHKLLPQTTRKILATFYTNPIASEILAGLSIDKFDEEVTDIACGSGTLLVADYRKKMSLYEKMSRKNEKRDSIHNKFLENDITGIDIMPFASHLTAVNLCSQRIDITTNKLRVGVFDSLDLEESIEVMPFSEIIQMAVSDHFKLKQRFLPHFQNQNKVIKRKGSVGPEGKGEKFVLKKSDTITMNPPFTDREKMPEDFRDKLNAKTKSNIINKKIKRLMNKCGKQVNLWGYFLAVADDLIVPNGKIGAVVPINIFRGAATQKIRDFILNNYHIKYIVKSTRDWGFSENAAFRDVLLITEKRKPSDDDYTGIIFLKQSLRDLTLGDADYIIEKIRSIKPGKIHIDEDIGLSWVKYRELVEKRNNLMPLVGVTSIRSKTILNDFLEEMKNKAGEKLTKLDKNDIKEGFHASPAGLSQLVFITRPTNEGRTGRAFMVLEKEDKDRLVARIKNTNILLDIEKSDVIPALRTITGINKIDIGKNQDYLIINEYPDFDKILTMSKWKGKFDWDIVEKKINGKKTHLAIPHRFRLFSPNTHLLTTYSDHKFISPHAFTIFTIEDKNKCKLLSLFLNSIVYLVQLYTLKKETTEAFTEIMEKDLLLMDILDTDKISKEEKKKLLDLFDDVKDFSNLSLIDQIKTKDPNRLKLDITIMKILGFSRKEIENWLPKLYNVLIRESKAIEKTNHH